MQYATVRCSALQRGVSQCSVLQCVVVGGAVRCSVLQCAVIVFHRVALFRIMLQCVENMCVVETKTTKTCELRAVGYTIVAIILMAGTCG